MLFKIIIGSFYLKNLKKKKLFLNFIQSEIKSFNSDHILNVFRFNKIIFYQYCQVNVYVLVTVI